VLEPGQSAFYLHVDDGIFLGDHRETVPTAAAQLMQRCADDLEELGMVVPTRLSGRSVEKVVAVRRTIQRPAFGLAPGA